MSNKSNRFSPEVRERAVRMVREHRGEYQSLWAAVESIAPKTGCVPFTLLDWVNRDEVDIRFLEGQLHCSGAFQQPTTVGTLST
jgi:transposase